MLSTELSTFIFFFNCLGVNRFLGFPARVFSTNLLISEDGLPFLFLFFLVNFFVFSF